ncbi:MAG: glycosyltransferase [Promethearchaeota archaeon]
MKENLWVLTFEYAGIIKVGGLGEVPAHQIEYLKDQYNVTVFLPSHGVHKNPKIIEKLKLKPLNFKCQCKINALKFNLGDIEEDIEIGFYKGWLNGVEFIIISGENEFTSSIMNDPVVYSNETIWGKFIIYARGIKYYTMKLVEDAKSITVEVDSLPDIVHCHDHHGVPAMINIRQALQEISMDCATVLTIHLLTWPRRDLDFLWACGIEDKEMDIYLDGQHRKMKFSEFYNFCKGNEKYEPTLEKIGIYFSDIVTSVSEDYLMSDVIANIGGGWVVGKSDYFWDGCDWDSLRDFKDIIKNFGKDLKAFIKKKGVLPGDNNADNNGKLKERYINFNTMIDKILDPDVDYQISTWDIIQYRDILRDFFLREAIGNLRGDEPKIDSKIVKNYLEKKLTQFPYISQISDKPGDAKSLGQVMPFDEDGPLIITTGRISKQKGIDTLLDSVTKVVSEFPDAKFVFFIMPTEFSLNEIDQYLEDALQKPKSIRIIFGKVFSLYKLLHLSADIYAAPSRWEPFGIMALEAMVSGIPVVASEVGGLKESVLDLKKDPINGTGLLVPYENPMKLSEALINLIAITKVDQLQRNGVLTEESKKVLLDKITIQELKDYVNKNPNFGSKVRENAIKRVENNFRWSKVSQKLLKIYENAKKNRGLAK